MKKYLLVFQVLFFLLITGQSTAQSKTEQKVTTAVENLKAAMISGERAALESIAADQLTYGHSSGMVENKAAFVEAIASGKSDFKTIELSEQTINISGKTAIVRHLLNATTHDAGKDPGTVKLKIILVFQKQGKDWKLLARQAVRVNP